MNPPEPLTDPLARIQFRLDRARAHARWISNTVDRLNEASNHTLRRETNHDGSEHRYYAATPIRVQDTLAVEASECLHNLRACLDNLIYRLAELNMARIGKELPEDSRLFAFPICLTKETLNRRRRAALAHTDKDTKALVRSFQPYMRWNPAETSPLWTLAQLQNIDKHRYLVRLLVDSHYWTHEVSAAHVIELIPGPGMDSAAWPDDGELVGTLTVDPPDTDLDLNFRPKLEVILDEGPGADQRVGSALYLMCSQVSEVVYAASQLPLVAGHATPPVSVL